MIKTIFIGNIGEIDIPLTRFMNEERREFQIFENQALCDRFLFSEGDDRVLITPYPLDKKFIDDTCRLLKFKNIQSLSPTKSEESICRSILKEKKLYLRLVELIEKNPQIKIIAYANTPEFIDFVLYLKKKGLRFKTPELPIEGKLWTVDFFGSKSGFRQAITKIKNKNLKQPEGHICSTSQETVGWARYFIEKKGGCVIKTNRGTAGEGVKIIKKDDLANEEDELFIIDFLNSEPCWKTNPIIVEEYVKADLTVAGGNPDVEYKIIDDKIFPLYFCGMRVTPEGAFKGLEFGRDSAADNIVDALFSWGDEWARLLKDMGYRGYFDVDCLYNSPGNIYLLESNARRTGGTHVYETAERLLGRGFLKNYYIIGNNLMPTSRFNKKDYRQLKSVVKSLLYPIEGKREGVILTIINILKQGRLGYMIIGPNKSRALEIENSFLNYL